MTDNKRVFYLAVGVAIGAGLGAALDNLALWLPLGIAIGAALAFGRPSGDDDDEGGEKGSD